MDGDYLSVHAARPWSGEEKRGGKPRGDPELEKALAEICLNCTEEKDSCEKCRKFRKAARALRAESVAIQDSKTSRNGRRPYGQLIAIDGESHTIMEWANISGLSVDCIYSRLKRGVSDADLIAPSRWQPQWFDRFHAWCVAAKRREAICLGQGKETDNA